MKAGLAAASLLLVPFGGSACAHRLDEYLQATIISLEPHRIRAEIRLTPGVAVLPIVMAAIDTNGDGVVSTAEQQAYAERVLADLSLTVDGGRVMLNPVVTKFPMMDEMIEGLGEIQLGFAADLRSGGPVRKIVFENRHMRPIAAYLVNVLAPKDPEIQISSQSRNYEQSVYRLNYVQVGVRAGLPPIAWWTAFVAALLLARLAVLLRQYRA